MLPGRVPWAQTKPGADAPRRFGRRRGWTLGRKKKAAGRQLGREVKLKGSLSGRTDGLLRGAPDRVGEQLSPLGQPRAHRLRGLGESQARKWIVSLNTKMLS